MRSDAEVIIVGGGAAGLSAALMLRRCLRSVLLFDTGKPRNGVAHATHGYLTRDGLPPSEWLKLAREEVLRYGARVLPEEVVDLVPDGERFTIRTAADQCFTARKVLIATGVRDILPQLAGFDDFYGTSVFHCPYCDAWEVRDQPLVAYGPGNRALPLALNLCTWSREVTLLTDGPYDFTLDERSRLERNGVTLCTVPVARLEGTAGMLQHVLLSDGQRLPCKALFFCTGHELNWKMPVSLGTEVAPNGEVVTDLNQRTGIRGVFVAGDASIDTHFISVACAEGAKAAVAIHEELRNDDALD